MSRSYLRQDAQIRRSITYDDTVAPTLAAYETNTVNAEDDFNHLRSQVQNILNRDGAGFPSGNWYDDLTAPSTLENGIQRGVDALNAALHLVEKKRIVRCVQLLVDVAVPAAVAATGILTLAANAADTETVVTGAKTYTLQTALTNVDGNVLIGATASDTIDNLIAAIILGAGAGATYAAATTANPDITAAAGAGDTMDATALVQGTQGNIIATTETLGNGSWGAATLAGGAGDLVILGAGELPTNTTAAVGAVTTLGTVVAHNATFGAVTLDEVAGSHALAPKNLLVVVNGATGDPILDGNGKQIWALIQSETITDAHTITDTTTTRVQLSFVVANATNDDLVFADAADIGGVTINYCYNERVRYEDLNEMDFLDSAAVDIGAAGAVSVTRQIARDNQGATVVSQTTDATLDLSAGTTEEVGDLNSDRLWAVIEGSGGGTSEVNVGSAVDVYNIDAIVNDFANGVTIDSGSAAPIAVGVTDGHVETTAGDLHVQAAAEIYFDDVNQVGSTWAQTDGVKLSETTAEWDAYEAAFGGEVSLLNAIVQAANNGAVNRTKGVAVVTAGTIAADVNVTGAAALNLDAQLPDYSTATFVDDVDVFLNGQLMRNGADASANHDVYPGDVPATGDLKFEFGLQGAAGNPDVITMILWAAA